MKGDGHLRTYELAANQSINRNEVMGIGAAQTARKQTVAIV